MHFSWRHILGAALTACAIHGASNIASDYSLSGSDLIGEIDWRPSSEFGAVVNQFYCSGFLHGQQVGWIQLGSGVPADGVRYRNNSGGDFGVNVLPDGTLRGFAYGANIGWINFEQRGNPRVDWMTGELHGAAYSANAGWISLDDAGSHVRLIRLPEPVDADSDGLPDAWEITHAGTLTRMNATTDADGDLQRDNDEYLAGTDPFNPGEKLGPLKIENVELIGVTIRWPSKQNHVYSLERRASLDSDGDSDWTVVTSNPLIGTGAELAVNLSASVSGPGFFRVRAALPLSQLN
jgi:hypothetical protein